MNNARPAFRLMIVDVDDADGQALREVIAALLSRGLATPPAEQSSAGVSPAIPQSTAVSSPASPPHEVVTCRAETTGGTPVPHVPQSPPPATAPNRRVLVCDQHPGQSFTAASAAALAGCKSKQLYDALRRSNGQINGLTFRWADAGTVPPLAPQSEPEPVARPDRFEARPRHAGSPSMPINPNVRGAAAPIDQPRDEGALDDEDDDRDEEAAQVDEDDDDDSADDD